MYIKQSLIIYICISVFSMGCNNQVQPTLLPEGNEKTSKIKVLETGASILQSNSPVNAMNIYLVGFHTAVEDPTHQMEAHHYCRQVNEDFAQCTMFDGNTEKANLVGIEYIISEKLFETLPEKEKVYWHPHNHEILSGQLIAPNLPEIAEKELMKSKMNSYGKTWHIWNSSPYGKKGDKLPYGEPKLDWSFNRTGEDIDGLVKQRDKTFKVDTNTIKHRREDLGILSNPQSGVDKLKDKFPFFTSPINGIVDKENVQ